VLAHVNFILLFCSHYLSAYADDELPDYIMVMVANRKTEEQMAEDLSLFLSNNTTKFTTWSVCCWIFVWTIYITDSCVFCVRFSSSDSI